MTHDTRHAWRMDFETYRTLLEESLSGSECPFPLSEFQARRAKVHAAMHAAGLDALLLTDPADIHYLTGYHTFEVSVHTSLTVRPDHCLLQVPSIETGPAATTAFVDEIAGYRWEAPETVIGPLADSLAGASSIGVDGWSPGCRHGLLSALHDRVGRQRFREAGRVLDDVRIVKTESELDYLRRSAAITASGLSTAEALVRPGVDENALAAAGAGAMLAAGSDFMSMQPIVTSGPRSSVIHLSHASRRVAPGDPVFLEFGAAYRRYTAPMMRTVVAGRSTPEMREVHGTCRAVFEALCAAMVPGARFDDAAMAGEAALAPVAGRVFFSGVFGYAVGAQFPPSWVEGSGFIARGQDRHFEANMVFHLPLCMRIPGQWGIGFSDTVLVGPNGARPLTDNDWLLTEREVP